jgi:uncharacterized LabA/DUF88 family protein
MSKRVGVFVDVSNLYYCIGKKFKYRKLDYRNFLKYIEPFGDLTQMIAYGAQMNDEAQDFVYFLRSLGFTTKWKTPKSYKNNNELKRKADWDVGIVIDIVEMIDRLDLVILATADGDMVPCVEWLKKHGIPCIVIASKISKDLRDASSKWVEIPESLLEDKK